MIQWRKQQNLIEKYNVISSKPVLFNSEKKSVKVIESSDTWCKGDQSRVDSRRILRV